MSPHDVTGLNGLLLLLVLAPLAVTTWGGINLYQLKPSGFDLTYASLLLQTIWVTGAKIAYVYFVGLRLWAGWEKSGTDAQIIGVDFLGSSYIRYSFDPVDIPFGTGINVITIALIFVLIRWQRNYVSALKTQDYIRSQPHLMNMTGPSNSPTQ